MFNKEPCCGKLEFETFANAKLKATLGEQSVLQYLLRNKQTTNKPTYAQAQTSTKGNMESTRRLTGQDISRMIF